MPVLFSSVLILSQPYVLTTRFCAFCHSRQYLCCEDRGPMTVMYMYHSIYMHVLCFSDLLLSKTDSEQSQLKEQ